MILEQFEEFVLPHLHIGSRGPQPKLSLHTTFNYILKLLYLGCQWKELPIQQNKAGRPEIHYTGIYRAFRRHEAQGCFDAIFAGSVLQLHQQELLDLSVIHGDGTTTAAKKSGYILHPAWRSALFSALAAFSGYLFSLSYSLKNVIT